MIQEGIARNPGGKAKGQVLVTNKFKTMILRIATSQDAEKAAWKLLRTDPKGFFAIAGSFVPKEHKVQEDKNIHVNFSNLIMNDREKAALGGVTGNVIEMETMVDRELTDEDFKTQPKGKEYYKTCVIPNEPLKE